jgi:glycosyltransferase involved in cell wall biosynthesis
MKLDFDILIINDGSKDDTLDTAAKLIAQYGNVKVINHRQNLGFGATLKEVFTLPESEWVLFLPGDNQFPIANIEVMMQLREKYDFILGVRKERMDSARRKFYSVFYNKIVSWASGVRVRDVNGVAFFKRDILSNILLRSNSAFIHAEIFIKTSRAGFKVTEVEVIHQEREFGFGAGGNIRVILATITELFLFLAGKI